ncbi:MAG: hypothetical protein V4543_10815 [Bacteroidota bacterium]
MKKFTFIYLPVFAAMLLLSSFTVGLNTFSAVYQVSGSIRVDWQVDSDDVTNFELSRKRAGDVIFTRIAVIPANANNFGNYSYVDSEIYKSVESGGELEYKLHYKTASGYEDLFTHTANAPTAAQKSWGSIKSMFK